MPEIRPGILTGYLPSKALPNSLALIPAPPAAASTALALDEEIYRQTRAYRGTPRWDLATEDANLMFPQAAGTFSCALNAPITEEDTPHLYRLMRRTLTDAGLSTYRAKDYYKRIRPFVVNKEASCTPDEEKQSDDQWLLSIRAFGNRLGLGAHSQLRLPPSSAMHSWRGGGLRTKPRDLRGPLAERCDRGPFYGCRDSRQVARRSGLSGRGRGRQSRAGSRSG